MYELFDLRMDCDLSGRKKITEDYVKKLKAHSSYPYFSNYDKNVFKVVKNNSRYYLLLISTYVTVEKRKINMDSNEVTFKLRIFNGTEYVSETVSSAVLSKQKISLLLTFGVRFEEKNAELLSNYLMFSEAHAANQKVYSKLGWNNINGQLCFRGNKVYTAEKVLDDCCYEGSFNIKSKGEFKNWVGMVKNEVIGNTPMEWVLALGFASPLLALLDDAYQLGSILFSLSGASSTGKTTAAMLASSVWGSPVINEGTMLSYNATRLSLEETLANANGLTACIDEVAMADSKDFTKLMYTFCSGSSRRKLNGDSTLKEVKKYSNIILSTAEFDILTEHSPEGLEARVFELNEKYTLSADNSEKIKNAVLNNYGMAGSIFLEQLVKKQYSEIEKKYKMIKETLASQSKESRLTVRMASKLAVVILTAMYMNEIFQGFFRLNCDEIKKFACNLINRNALRENPEENLIQVLLYDVKANGYKYGGANDENDKISNCIGMVQNTKDYTKICIIKNYFEDLMNKNNINNYRCILNKLKNEKILKTDSDGRLTYRIKVRRTNQKVAYYCFMLPNSPT